MSRLDIDVRAVFVEADYYIPTLTMYGQRIFHFLTMFKLPGISSIDMNIFVESHFIASSEAHREYIHMMCRSLQHISIFVLKMPLTMTSI